MREEQDDLRCKNQQATGSELCTGCYLGGADEVRMMSISSDTIPG